MKCLFVLVLLLSFSIKSFSQKEKFPKYYYMNGNFDYVAKFTADGYILSVDKINNHRFEYCYYSGLTLKLLRLETYTNEEADTAKGLFAYYNHSGNLDSIGQANYAKREGIWYFYNSNGKKKDSVLYCKKYQAGILIDSAKTFEPKEDAVFVEPIFEGSFTTFLTKNLRYPDAALNGKFQGKTGTMFVVNTSGELEDLVMIESANIFLDNEAKRVLKKSSGKWKPCEKNGKPIPSYHIQPIQFVIPEL